MADESNDPKTLEGREFVEMWAFVVLVGAPVMALFTGFTSWPFLLWLGLGVLATLVYVLLTKDRAESRPTR